MTAEMDSTFARWAYSHYFQFVKEKDKNLIVKCNLCAHRELSTSRNSTSNLKKHLDRCHASTKLTVSDRDEGSQKRKTPGDESTGQSKQQKLNFSRPHMLEPREVKRLVAEYIVEDMQPLSTVESPAFRKIVSSIPVNISNDKVR